MLCNIAEERISRERRVYGIKMYDISVKKTIGHKKTETCFSSFKNLVYLAA
jgi:hypothetical protein